MKLVQNQAQRIMKILGYQKYDPNIKYKKSQFVLDHVLLDGTIVIHSTLTKYIHVLEEDLEVSDWKDFENATEMGKQFFVGLWYYVPEDMDEFKLVENVRSIYRRMADDEDKKVNNISIVTTTGCNARCAYCFEKGVTPKFMTEQTAKDVLEYIKKYSSDQFRMTWFGGEPLLNTKVMDIISGGLRECNKPFKSTIVTNGYLFNDEIIRKCKEEWNVVTVQVTLDGVDDTYNQIKDYVYKDVNAYEVVIGNVKKLVDAKIGVSIRINVGYDNVKSCYQVVDRIAEIVKPGDLLNMNVSMLFEFKDDEVKRTVEERNFLNKAVTEIQRYIEQKRITRMGFLNPAMPYNQCMADTKTALLITADGRLTKCEHEVDSEGYGSVNDDPKDYDKEYLDDWKRHYEYSEMCHTCIHLPDCVSVINCEDAYFHIFTKDGVEYHECWPSGKERLRMVLEMGVRNAVNDFYYALEQKEKEKGEQ